MATGIAGVELREIGREGGPIDESAFLAGTLPFADALRMAVTTDPGLQAALARVRVAMAEADQARLLPNPVVSLVLKWGGGKPQIEASLAQEIVRALRIPRLAGAADARLRRAAAEAVTTALDVAGQVHERYIAAQALGELVPLLRQRMELLERLAEVARARFDAGEGTRADMATLRAQAVELAVEIDAVLLAEREERVRLARLIGQPSSPADWTLQTWEAPDVELAPEADFVREALARRPEVSAVEWELDALDHEAVLAGLEAWNVEAGVDAERDDGWAAGPAASVSLPIFDTGSASRARIQALRLEAAHELTLVRRKIVEEVRTAYGAMVASAANLRRLTDELIPLQEERRAMAEQAYRAGQSDVTELYLAEQDLRLAREKSIEVKKQAATSMVRLQRAVGGAGALGQVGRAEIARDQGKTGNGN